MKAQRLVKPNPIPASKFLPLLLKYKLLVLLVLLDSVIKSIIKCSEIIRIKLTSTHSLVISYDSSSLTGFFKNLFNDWFFFGPITLYLLVIIFAICFHLWCRQWKQAHLLRQLFLAGIAALLVDIITGFHQVHLFHIHHVVSFNFSDLYFDGFMLIIIVTGTAKALKFPKRA